MAYSPDGRWLASAGGDDHVAKLWDVSAGMEVVSLTHADNVAGVAFSPDGRTLATASWDGTVTLWSVPSGERRAVLSGHAGAVLCVAFSSDGKLVASGDNRGTVTLWDAATGASVSTASYGGMARGVAFHPRGTSLATAVGERAESSGVFIWNLSERRQGPRLSGHAGGVNGVAFSADGRWLASGGDDHTVKLWDTTTWQERRTLAGHAAAVNTVTFAPNGRTLASGSGERVQSGDDTVRIWDVETGRQLRSLGGGVRQFGGLAFTADGRYLAASGWGPVLVWDTASGTEYRRLARRISGGKEVAFSRSGRWLAVADSASVALWDVAEGRGPRVLRGQRESFDAVAFSTDERWVAARAHREIKVWETSTGATVATLGGTECSFGELAFSNDGAWLAAGSCNVVRRWDTAAWREGSPLTGHRAPIGSLAFSPESGLLFTASRRPLLPGDASDDTIRVWDVASGREVQEREVATRGDVTALSFGATDRFLVVAAGDGQLSVVGQPNVRLKHPAFVTALAVAAQNRRIASAGCGDPLLLWDLASTRARTLSGPTGCVRSLAFSPDGRWLVSTGDDGGTRLWDVNDATQAALLTVMSAGDDWAVVTPEGLFDGSARGSQELVGWRIGTRILPPDRFFADYFTPGLLASILAEQAPKPRVDLAALQLPPDVRITSPANGAVPEQPIRAVVEANDLGGGVAEVRMYHNGKLIGSQAGKTGPTTRYEFVVSLVAGENRLTARALSAAQVDSNEDAVRVVFNARGARPVEPADAPPDAPSKPVLRLLVVGINEFEDPDFNLRYARPDAQSIAAFFEDRRDLFASVSVTRLMDGQATKAGLEAALRALETQSQPTDLVLIYLAGHGVSVGQQWYFLTHDMRKETDEEAAVRRHGISGLALSQSLLQMKALKQLLVIDACQSGGVLTTLSKSLEFRSGQEKALKMLARANGFHMIAASTAAQYALEVPELGHGVMTYALLSGLGESGRPRAPVVEEGIVTVTSLLQYIGQQVPELTERYHQGSTQYPVQFSTGMDFPLCYCADPR